MWVFDTNGHADHVFNNSFFVQKREEVLGIGFEDIPLLEQLESSGGWMGAQPEASPVLSGGSPGPHKIQGIGAGFKPDILDLDLIDHVSRLRSVCDTP